ncbi:MAG: GNAT family N-acetyltransferase [Bacillota bacterium]
MRLPRTGTAQIMKRLNRLCSSLPGLLDRPVPSSPFSLAEAQVLLEIREAREQGAAGLEDLVGLETGYFEEVLGRLERNGFIERSSAGVHGVICLTGRALRALDGMSQETLSLGPLGGLSRGDLQSLDDSLTTMERLLVPAKAPSRREPAIRWDIRPGDIGSVIRMHALIYSQECGYNLEFEAYVAGTLQEFAQGYSPEKDRLWMAEVPGAMVGCIGIVGRPGPQGQLRWLLVHPVYRGAGLGSRLISEAVGFCRDSGFGSAYLLTTSDQQDAIAMYRRAGFRKTWENPVKAWGKDLVEERYDLVLGKEN